MEFAKKNGICTGFWIFGGRRPAAEGRSQSIEITLTTYDPHPIFSIIPTLGTMYEVLIYVLTSYLLLSYQLWRWLERWLRDFQTE